MLLCPFLREACRKRVLRCGRTVFPLPILTAGVGEPLRRLACHACKLIGHGGVCAHLVTVERTHCALHVRLEFPVGSEGVVEKCSTEGASE